MAAGHFEVDTNYLRQTTNELRQHLQTLTRVRGELLDKLSEVAGMWEGPAKEAFHLQFQNDCDEFKEICTQLDETLECIDYAAKEYDACDASVRNIVDAIKV